MRINERELDDKDIFHLITNKSSTIIQLTIKISSLTDILDLTKLDILHKNKMLSNVGPTLAKPG